VHIAYIGAHSGSDNFGTLYSLERTAMWKDVANKADRRALTEWRASVVTSAYTLLNTFIPRKILELNALIAVANADEASLFHPSKLQSIASAPLVLPERSKAEPDEPMSKKRKLDSATNGTNGLEHAKFLGASEPPAAILAAIDTLRTEWELVGRRFRLSLLTPVGQMVDCMEQLRLYITLQIPTAEHSGDNSGVATQEGSSRYQRVPV
jgi:hypothetical protein